MVEAERKSDRRPRCTAARFLDNRLRLFITSEVSQAWPEQTDPDQLFISYDQGDLRQWEQGAAY